MSINFMGSFPKATFVRSRKTYSPKSIFIAPATTHQPTDFQGNQSGAGPSDRCDLDAAWPPNLVGALVEKSRALAWCRSQYSKHLAGKHCRRCVQRLGLVAEVLQLQLSMLHTYHVTPTSSQARPASRKNAGELATSKHAATQRSR